MKKQYLLMAAFASALAFTACSNEDDLGGINPNPVVSDVVEGATFEISLSGEGEGTTKAVRPMGSSAADNDVTAIALKAYKYDGSTWNDVTSTGATKEENKVAFVYVEGAATNTVGEIIPNGILTYDAANPEGEGVPGTDTHINKKAKIEVVGLEANKQYQFVAYGYNGGVGGSTYPYTNSPVGAGEGFQNGVFQANVNFEAENETDKYTDVEEIFAANDMATTTTIKEMEGEQEVDHVVFSVSPSLTLKRQVAGILAYFQHVPAFLQKYNDASGKLYKVVSLDIVASHSSKDIYFPAVLLDNEDFNGIATEGSVEEVLMTFDFSKIASNYSTLGQDNAQGAGVEYAFWNLSQSGEVGYVDPFAEGYEAPDDLALVDGSIFGARYILPYDQHYSDETTLKLRFYGENDALLEEREITTSNVPNGATMYTYDIRCNNFYSIGQKLATDDTDGPDDEDDDDDDKPIDLRSDNINVRINDAWAVLHNMGVDNIE